MPFIPLSDLHKYHSTDRDLFKRLVVHLTRNPAESLLVMAFWFWLEDNQFPCLITSLLMASDYTVNTVADEAMICLNSLAVDQSIPPATDTSFISNMMEQNPVAMMHADKLATINRIKYFINNVCARIFTDILDGVIEGDPETRGYYHPFVVPGFPHPTFGNFRILKLPLSESFDVDDLWGWSMSK